MTSNSRPFLSVCIPAYNRAAQLSQLFDSILVQDFDNYEVVVCEDNSPESEKIFEVCQQYIQEVNLPIRFIKNPKTLGYDGNLRRLVDESSGEYCFFVGNDDLVYPGAFAAAARLLTKYPSTGVLLRSYLTFKGDVPGEPSQTYYYFENDAIFPPGRNTIVTFFRRCVVISGLIVHRDSAKAVATDEYDGTLLYQLFLVGNLLKDKPGIYCRHPMAWYRLEGVPDFGNAEAEKAKFKPKEQTAESSVFFMQGMIRIAQDLEKSTSLPVFKGIINDIGNYSYPILAIQSKRSRSEFINYAMNLMALGIKGKYFYVYFLFLMLFGSEYGNVIIGYVKRLLKKTPNLGGVCEGKSV